MYAGLCWSNTRHLRLLHPCFFLYSALFSLMCSWVDQYIQDHESLWSTPWLSLPRCCFQVDVCGTAIKLQLASRETEPDWDEPAWGRDQRGGRTECSVLLGFIAGREPGEGLPSLSMTGVLGSCPGSCPFALAPVPAIEAPKASVLKEEHRIQEAPETPEFAPMPLASLCSQEPSEGQQHVRTWLATGQPAAAELGTHTSMHVIDNKTHGEPQGDLETARATEPSCAQSVPMDCPSTCTGDFLSFCPRKLAQHITWIDAVSTGLQAGLPTLGPDFPPQASSPTVHMHPLPQPSYHQLPRCPLTPRFRAGPHL